MDVLDENGVLLNKTKCMFKAQELDFLGHQLSNNGKKQTRKSINYSRFLSTTEQRRSSKLAGVGNPDLGTAKEPLHQLVKRHTI